MIIDAFAPHVPSLANFNTLLKRFVHEIEICHRSGVTSAVVGFRDFLVMQNLIQTEPERFRGVGRMGVDLDSLATNEKKVYVDFHEDGIQFRGFVLDANDSIVQVKTYKIGDTPGQTIVDRFDAAGEEISTNEVEQKCDRSGWTGPDEIADVADGLENVLVGYTEKKSHSHSYVRVTTE